MAVNGNKFRLGVNIPLEHGGKSPFGLVPGAAPKLAGGSIVNDPLTGAPRIVTRFLEKNRGSRLSRADRKIDSFKEPVHKFI